MKQKKNNLYLELFSWVFKQVGCEPAIFITDFKEAPICAFKHILKNSIVNGCTFHYSQIIWRFVQNKGAVTVYNNDFEFQKCVKYILLLPYVPVKHINYEFLKLKNEYYYGDLNKIFLDFFEDNFIRNIHNVETKKIEFWSVHDRIINKQPGTTNSVEAWHRYLNLKAEVKHPNICKCIDVIRVEENKMKIQINNLMNGKKSMCSSNQSSQLRNILSNYKEYVKFEFFEILSSIVGLKLN
jgi:hypothetical protein